MQVVRRVHKQLSFLGKWCEQDFFTPYSPLLLYFIFKTLFQNHFENNPKIKKNF